MGGDPHCSQAAWPHGPLSATRKYESKPSARAHTHRLRTEPGPFTQRCTDEGLFLLPPSTQTWGRTVTLGPGTSNTEWMDAQMDRLMDRQVAGVSRWRKRHEHIFSNFSKKTSPILG